LGQGLPVLAGAIPLVAGKAVAGIVLLQRDHELVAGHLGDDAGGGDAQTVGVGLGQRPLGQVQVRQSHIVHQQRVRPPIQLLHRAGHGLSRGWDDSPFVHLGGRGPTHSHGVRRVQNQRDKSLPLGWAELLGITHASQQLGQVRAVERQHDRRSADRSCPRATSHLVQPGHAGVAGGV
jgi:hypothetical protein